MNDQKFYAGELACFDRLPKAVQEWMRNNDIGLVASQIEKVVIAHGERQALTLLERAVANFKRENPMVSDRRTSR